MKRAFPFVFIAAALIAAGCLGAARSTAPASRVVGLPTIPRAATAAPRPAYATPAPTPTPTRTPTPTSTPAGRLGPDNFPPGINPLTGLAADPQRLAAPPLNIKISNAPACVRPQYGLAQADVIFEHYVEAWATRFTAVFHSQSPSRVGSVRSARLLDLELPAIFGANFLFSGASAGVQRRMDGSDFARRTIHALDLCPVLCRVPAESAACKDRTHTLFADAIEAQTAFAARGFGALRFPLEGWAFSAQPFSPGAPAAEVAVDYLNAPVRWTYDADRGLYRRAQSGAPHTDAATGLTLTAANVVVLFANHVYSDIQESTLWYSLEIQFWGSGPALLFRDGQAFEGQWVRERREGLFALADPAGNSIPLHPGQTWFEMVGLDSARAAAGDRWSIDPQELPLQTPPHHKTY